MSKQLRLDVAQLTDVGRKRPHNEDNMAYVIPKDEHVMARKGALFIVADGMGGHAAGEVASEIAVDTVTVTYYQDDSEDIALSLMNAIKRANTIIHQRAAENMLRSGMGTTCVSAVLRGKMAYIANVGDSRAYVIRQGHVKQVSQDHSWVEEQVRAGLLTRDQARSHAQRNVITRCLGTQVDVEVDVFTEELEDGDCLILCTDGLSGSVYEEDLRSIVEQYVPQESVYHLVERANENGGPDNITAIVVRVQELGTEPPAKRHLVHVGGSDVSADEDTAILGRPSSSVMSMSMRVDEGRFPSPSLRAAPSGPLFSPSSNVSLPQPAVISPRPKRNRLLYPTLALLVVFVIALFTGGAYYFWRLQTDASQELAQAAALISPANPNNDAVSALQKLVAAQDDLRSIQSPLLVGSQSGRFAALQNSLQNKGRQAISNYNKQASINSLCNTITNTSMLNLTGAGGQSPVMASVLQGQTTTSYLLAGDSNLYLFDGQKSQKTKEPLPNGTVPFLLASNGQHLFVVTRQLGQGSHVVSYALHMYKPGKDGTLMDESNSPRLIDAKLMRNGEQPKLITVWNSDVYIFLSASNASTLDILNYNTDHFTSDPQRVQISVSLPLVSAAAFPNQQLFLLTQDGHIKSLALSSSNNSNQPPSPVEVTLPRPIATPVGVDPQDFQWNTPLVVPSQQTSREIQPPFANVTGATLLASGSIKEAMYLFVVDNSNHRILQLQYLPNNTVSTAGTNGGAAADPPATPTQAAVGGAAVAPPLQYTKQYVSTSELSSMKSIMVDSNQAIVSLLTQTGGNSLNQVSINLTRTCASSS